MAVIVIIRLLPAIAACFAGELDACFAPQKRDEAGAWLAVERAAALAEVFELFLPIKRVLPNPVYLC